MIKKFINKIWKSEGQESINTPEDLSAEFVLMFNELTVGKLSLEKGIWKFVYSLEFKNQEAVSPLIDFPETNKVYESSQLWPYFSYRIPGLNQPMVQDIIKNDKIEGNEVALLKKFGRYSIFSPFELKVSH